MGGAKTSGAHLMIYVLYHTLECHRCGPHLVSVAVPHPFPLTLFGTFHTAYMLQFDSVHGKWKECREAADGQSFTVEGKTVTFSANKNIGDTDWKAGHIFRPSIS
jgi:hypothetical protein